MDVEGWLRALSSQVDLPVPDDPKRPWTQQGRVQGFWPVRGGQNNDRGFSGIEAIHFRQKLIQGLFSLVVTAVEAAGGAGFANSI